MVLSSFFYQRDVGDWGEKCKHEKHKRDGDEVVEIDQAVGWWNGNSNNRANVMAVSFFLLGGSGKQKISKVKESKSNKRKLILVCFSVFSNDFTFILLFLLSWQWLLILRLFPCYLSTFF